MHAADTVSGIESRGGIAVIFPDGFLSIAPGKYDVACRNRLYGDFGGPWYIVRAGRTTVAQEGSINLGSSIAGSGEPSRRWRHHPSNVRAGNVGLLHGRKEHRHHWRHGSAGKP